jgi:hypothetical protein
MLLYGSDARTITAAEQKRLEAMDMWGFRGMMKVKWTERVSCEEIQGGAGEKRHIMSTLGRRRGKLFGHFFAAHQPIECGSMKRRKK